MKALLPFSKVAPDAWPSPFRRFLDARLSSVDPLANGRATTWRKSTFERYVGELGYFLGWLHWNGRYREDMELVDYVTPEITKAYVADMEKFGLAPPSIANRLDGLHAAMAVLAAKGDRRWLMRGINRLRALPSDRRRTRERMQHTADVVDLGMGRMRKAEYGEGLSDLRRAILFRDGLLLVFMALAVPRIGVVPGMRLGQHLIRQGETCRIAWSSEEMKAGQPYDAQLPRELSALLARYLDAFRPILLKRRDDVMATKEKTVWLTMHGMPMSQRAIYRVITERTGAVFDEYVFPHALRHGAATTLAIERPDLIKIVTPLLQHRHAQSRQLYDLSDGIEASTKFGQSLEERRTASFEGRRLMNLVSKGRVNREGRLETPQ